MAGLETNEPGTGTQLRTLHLLSLLPSVLDSSFLLLISFVNRVGHKASGSI